MTTLSDGTTSVVPMLVLGWTDAYAPRTLVHSVLGRTDPDVTLRPSALRNGTLRVLCATQSDKQAVLDLHATGVVYDLVEDDLETLDMSYVVSGAITTTLDEQTIVKWIVEIPYHEVLP